MSGDYLRPRTPTCRGPRCLALHFHGHCAPPGLPALHAHARTHTHTHTNSQVVNSAVFVVDTFFVLSGALGAVVFAGGVAIEQPFVSTIVEAQWRQVIEVELIGFTRVVAAAIPVLRASGGGSITAISSVANYCYPPGDALSSVPKAAIESLCRAVAKEEGRAGIRANAVAPGIIDAGLGAQFLTDL